jgi:hypothetical protein
MAASTATFAVGRAARRWIVARRAPAVVVVILLIGSPKWNVSSRNGAKGDQVAPWKQIKDQDLFDKAYAHMLKTQRH